jgi:hypothetical protein
VAYVRVCAHFLSSLGWGVSNSVSFALCVAGQVQSQRAEQALMRKKREKAKLRQQQELVASKQERRRKEQRLVAEATAEKEEQDRLRIIKRYLFVCLETVSLALMKTFYSTGRGRATRALQSLLLMVATYGNP